MTRVRAFRLLPWLIRAVIPHGRIGSYVLFIRAEPAYVGRSDTDLRRRLLEHAASRRGDFFTYDVHGCPLHAYQSECSLFHNLAGRITNSIHPSAPAFSHVRCDFCGSQLPRVLSGRLSI